MSAEQTKLAGIVGGLRNRQLLAITMSALIETLLFAACVYALLRLGLPNVVLSAKKRAVLAMGMLVVLAAAVLLEHSRQSRSTLFLAKRIDDANQLNDHLVSALAFQGPSPSGFQQACINAFMLRLQNTQLRIPSVRVERVWLLLPAVLLAAATAGVDYRLRQKPSDDGNLTIGLPAELRARVRKIAEMQAETVGKVDPGLSKEALATRQALDKILEHSASKESVLRDLASARAALAKQEADASRIVDAALQLGDPAGQRSSQMLSALRQGQAAPVGDALKSLADALSGKSPPPLSSEERAEIASILEAVAEASHAPALSTELRQVASDIREAKSDAKSATGIDALRPKLAEQLTREAATKQLAATLRSALAEVGRQTAIAAQNAGAARGEKSDVPDGGVSKNAGPRLASTGSDDETGDTQLGSGGAAAAGTGAGTAVEPNYGGGSPERALTAVDQRVTAPWINAPAKQVVAAGSTADDGTKTALRVLLGAEQRVLERQVRREEIPAEYAQSIRRYFSNIQQDWEQKWKPNK